MPTDDHVPCLAWSRHAADLAEPIAQDLLRWRDSPTTDAMIADGLLARIVPDVHIAPDRLDSAVGRVLALGAALGPLLRSDHVVAGVSAAWVHAGGPPPARPALISSAHRAVIGGVRIRSVALGSGDLETIGGAPVTTPERTGMDLLREGLPEGDQALVQLLGSGHLDRMALAARVQRDTGRDLSRQLLARLEEIVRQLPPPRLPRPAQEPVEIGLAASIGLPSAVTR